MPPFLLQRAPFPHLFLHLNPHHGTFIQRGPANRRPASKHLHAIRAAPPSFHSPRCYARAPSTPIVPSAHNPASTLFRRLPLRRRSTSHHQPASAEPRPPPMSSFTTAMRPRMSPPARHTGDLHPSSVELAAHLRRCLLCSPSAPTNPSSNSPTTKSRRHRLQATIPRRAPNPSRPVPPSAPLPFTPSAALALHDTIDWWDEVNNSAVWQDRVFLTLAALFGLVVVVALI